MSALSLGCLLGLGLGAFYLVGTVASAPAPEEIGPAPSDLSIEPVTIASPSGSRLSGWFVAGRPRTGAVLLMHSLWANRLDMVDRARLLNEHGFAVLLFDFQAHGESTGQRVTFGYLEAQDARAAFGFLRRRMPAERIGVIGLSMGGAAAVLGELPADAMVLEAVYADFSKAVENRLAFLLGAPGRYLAPMLTWQVQLRLGFDYKVLQPAERISKLRVPLLLIAGGDDGLATLEEAKTLFARARQPKQLWVIPGARHVDFHYHYPTEYERRVLVFLRRRLNR